ncbi:MAG: 30S ribosomal protein S6 [Sedimentisphaerales bacterium]|nr:30S ribosomal protein S6 [Sedimentisphaerales bacterium]
MFRLCNAGGVTLAQGNKRTYEGLFLVDSAVASANWDDVIKTLNTVFKRAKAKASSITKWDERRLCYEINGHKRGTYILCYFDADPDSITGIERDVQLSEVILRVMILRADKIPAEIISEPTPAMLIEQAKEAAEQAKETAEMAKEVTQADAPEEVTDEVDADSGDQGPDSAPATDASIDTAATEVDSPEAAVSEAGSPEEKAD